ncbi:hypothetical protein Tco_1516809 [Tanacetum coccineum]
MTESTLIETNKALLKDEEAEDVDDHLYRSMIGSLMYLTASRPDIMFAVCACAMFQVTPKVSHLHVVKRIFRYLKVANSTTEAEYVVAANCCGQNLMFHSKTKHIEIRHHFIRDSYEKRLIQVIKIHTDHNVADLLTKAFDVSRYSLTISPTIYASYIEQFWATAKSKIVNNEMQIHAKVDGKTIVISESSVRSNLHFNDEDGVTSLTNSKILENLALMGYEIVSDKLTFKKLSFPLNGIVEDEGSGQPSKPQPPSSTAPPSQEEQSSGPPEKVSDEAVHKELGDRVERAATTAASLDEEQDSGGSPMCQEAMGGSCLGNIKDCSRFGDQQVEKESQKLENKLRARTPGMKLFKIGTSKRKSLDEEYVSKQGSKSDKTKPMFDDSDFVELDVDNAMQNVEVNTASINVITADLSTSIVGDIFEDEMMTIANTLVAIRSTRPRTTSVVIRDVEEEPRRATPIPTVQSQDKEDQAQFEREQRIARERAAEQEAKDAALIEQMEDIQARMDADELLAERLQQEEREQFTIEEKSRMLVEMIAERKRFFAAQRAEQIRNKPPTRAQLRNKMVTYLKHMGKYTHNQMKSKSFEEIQKLYEREQKWINDFVPIDSEVVKDSRKGKAEGSRKKTVARKRTGEKLDDESVKRQKIEDDAEKEALRAYLDIISGDDEAVNVESLAIKYPIVDWKTHALSEDKMYYEIINGDGSTKSYKIFTKMLDDFDRQDVLDLYRLVKERFETASPKYNERILWGDPKLFLKHK